MVERKVIEKGYARSCDIDFLQNAVFVQTVAYSNHKKYIVRELNEKGYFCLHPPLSIFHQAYNTKTVNIFIKRTLKLENMAENQNC
ncbi:hypothetical protein Bhyg_15401 [Pseudolycoriella hygida]|uniref:Uncharacterized protein n=1 Tax=Pseudolycoriella hygida TaxID=35572 RepID=A0A9Q0RY75_9DIPT|nr:hypothetical protein Bhyg_15401 [Pseudolycoriella hygida]